ncbi:hypothetical protein F4703DRAFT_1845930 [Phycomyces blakesleeanus]
MLLVSNVTIPFFGSFFASLSFPFFLPAIFKYQSDSKAFSLSFDLDLVFNLLFYSSPFVLHLYSSHFLIYIYLFSERQRI